jgi:hypothetical protein
VEDRSNEQTRLKRPNSAGQDPTLGCCAIGGGGVSLLQLSMFTFNLQNTEVRITSLALSLIIPP